MAFTIFLVAAACLMAVVKGDYTAEKKYKDSATCKAAGGAVLQTMVLNIDSGCVSLGSGSAYAKYFCTGSKLQYQQYTSSTCATTSGQIQDSAFTESCDTTNSTNVCVAGTFTAPTGTVNVQLFTTNKCDVPSGFGYVSGYGFSSPDKACVPNYSDSTSTRFTCSAGTTSVETYKGTTCSGTATGTATAKSGECTTISFGGSPTFIKASCTAASSGATSASITILSFVLLVLATFSSTM